MGVLKTLLLHRTFLPALICFCVVKCHPIVMSFPFKLSIRKTTGVLADELTLCLGGRCPNCRLMCSCESGNAVGMRIVEAHITGLDSQSSRSLVPMRHPERGAH